MGCTKIKKILIAHRSEIALRIHKTAHALGIKTVAIYGPEDSHLSYVHHADEAYPLSLAGAQGYLNQGEIITIACSAKVDAIHPGYGFLSENALFAQKVLDAGLIWIGPAPQVIALMGDKTQARLLMQKIGIPIVSGHYVNTHEPDALLTAYTKASEIGYPILLKDPLGGGGKGMRKVSTADEFEKNWETVKREAQKLTGSSILLIEKYLENTRHIEIQIAGDKETVIHLYERECSLQRRHQKIIEEAPCLFVSKQTLEKMYTVACTIGKTVGYTNIGTVEFLVTSDEQFYFLEMNTRLQVEHAVTELTLGIDLVALQLSLAEDNQLPYQQSDLVRRGHALECRINAEDPSKNFLPSGGLIHHLVLPEGPFLRHDHDLHQGMGVGSYFDPLLSKVITFGENRELAINYMREALQSFTLTGLATNLSFLIAILDSHNFTTGTLSTQILGNHDYLSELLDAMSPKKNNQDDLSDQEIAAIFAMLASTINNQKESRLNQELSSQKSPSQELPSTANTQNWRTWKNQAKNQTW